MLSSLAQANDRNEGLDAFRAALRQLGWREGENVELNIRYAGGDFEKMRSMASEIIQTNPDVIFTITTPATAAVQRLTSTIPIVFTVVSDPVGSGFVQNLAKPGGNLTGLVNIEGSVAVKWIDILRRLFPRLVRADLIFNPDTAPYFRYYTTPFQLAGAASGTAVAPRPVRSQADIATAISDLGRQTRSALVLMPDTFVVLARNVDLTIELAANEGVPVMYPYPHMTKAGGLISYGVDAVDLYRRSAEYVDRILRGARPSELPVQSPTKFALTVNLRAAEKLGVTIPPDILARADEVTD